MSSKWVLHVALLSVAFSSAAVLANDPSTNSGISWGKITNNAILYGTPAPIAFLTLSAFLLIHRQSQENFTPKGEWGGLLRVDRILSKQYWNNANDVFWDRWVGQVFKDGHMELNKFDGSIKQSKKCLPYGVMGKTAALLHEWGKSKDLLLGIGALATGALGFHYLGTKGMFTSIRHKFGLKTNNELAKEEEEKVTAKETQLQKKRIRDTQQQILKAKLEKLNKENPTT